MNWTTHNVSVLKIALHKNKKQFNRFLTSAWCALPNPTARAACKCWCTCCLGNIPHKWMTMMSHFKICNSVNLLYFMSDCENLCCDLRFQHLSKTQVCPHMAHVVWTRIIIKIGVLNCVMLPKPTSVPQWGDEAVNNRQLRLKRIHRVTKPHFTQTVKSIWKGAFVGTNIGTVQPGNWITGSGRARHNIWEKLDISKRIRLEWLTDLPRFQRVLFYAWRRHTRVVVTPELNWWRLICSIFVLNT